MLSRLLCPTRGLSERDLSRSAMAVGGLGAHRPVSIKLRKVLTLLGGAVAAWLLEHPNFE
jgi:hypothetical protein